MTKLTLNRLAFAGLRANRKESRLLWVGIFFAVFFTVGTLLGMDILFQKYDRQIRAAYGREDAILFDADISPEALTGQGLAKKAGTVTLVGTLRDFPVGYYDENAQDLLSRQCLEGHLPQAPGEIAMDQRVLERLFPNARAGDTLTLFITAADGKRVQRECRLVGILQGQFSGDARGLLKKTLPQDSLDLPQVLLAPQEQLPPVCRHMVFTFPLGVRLADCQAAYPGGAFLGISRTGSTYTDGQNYGLLPALLEVFNLGSSLILAGSSLLLASILGIFSTVSGQFHRKEDQYRMLKIIGATRGQIRALSSRESVLLALLTAPVGSLCALLFVSVLRFFFPESLPYPPRLGWLLVGIVLSTLLVWLAARLPGLLYRPEIAPRRRLLPVRSHKHFSLPSLWNRRKFRFHPFRSLCSALLTALFCVSFPVFLDYSIDSLQDIPGIKAKAYSDMDIRAIGYRIDTGYFTFLPTDHLSADDLSQLEAMPGVQKASGYWLSNVIALTDHVGSYYPLLNDTNRHLFQYRPELLTARQQKELDTDSRFCEIYRYLQQQLHTQQIPISLRLVVLDDVTQLEPYLTSGSIDLDAINQGRAVLADFPTYYEFQIQGGTSKTREPGPDAIRVIQNDQIFAGDTLPLIQLCLREGTYDPQFFNGAVENFPFAQAETYSAAPVVCGVLSQGKYGFHSGVIITTPQGLKNLGLRCDSTQSITVDLAPDATSSQKSALWAEMQRLAFREDDLEATDNTNFAAVFRGTLLRGALFHGGLTAMLLLLTVLQLQGDIRRQLRSEKRTIGILRAVGCDEDALLHTYRRQILLSTCLGWLLALCFYLKDYAPSYLWNALLGKMRDTDLFRLPPRLFCAAALVAIINIFLLKRELHQVIASSVIENIREE